MKDAYSFDVDEDGLARSYLRNREAYIKVFDRLGLDYVVVSATSGAMGGSVSEEFLAPCENGEDSYVTNQAGSFAANVEAFVTSAPQPVSDSEIAATPACHVEDTPDTPTIETLVACANSRNELRRPDRDWLPSDTLKNVVVKVTDPQGQQSALAIGIPGDREVDLRRLEAALAPATVSVFEDEDFIKHAGLIKGYIGPQALGLKSSTGMRYLVDPRVIPGTRWVTGANQKGRHVFDLVAGRDFTPDGVIDVAEVREGDPSPDGKGSVQIARGIEIGHIFQLGRKYAQALDLTVLDANGERVVVTMGSYGIGVTRAVAAIAEQHHDDKGLIWPVSVAPYQVHIVVAGKEEAQAQAANEIADELSNAGLDVLLDDRASASTGVKFNDAELLGMPFILVIGRSLAEGQVELRVRKTGETSNFPVKDAAAQIAKRIATEQK
jgi:prolyl-tRNA synthetase